MAVDTKQVTERRQVQYATLQDILNDAERLSRGPITTLGNWSAGQIFSHLATAMNGSIDGLNIQTPWYYRLMGRLFKKQMLRGPMPPGFQLPPEAAREMVPGPKTTEEGLAELRAAIHRLETEDKRTPSAFLGYLTREEWNQLHCTHAALHMSFLND
jgi:hypothetical protein